MAGVIMRWIGLPLTVLSLGAGCRTGAGNEEAPVELRAADRFFEPDVPVPAGFKLVETAPEGANKGPGGGTVSEARLSFLLSTHGM